MAKSRRRPLKTIQYFCNGFCTASVKKKHMRRGDLVVLIADGTNARIKFRTTSPFVSGVTTFTIPADTARLEIVSNTAGFANFEYTLSCPGSCPSPTDNPMLIVDP